MERQVRKERIGVVTSNKMQKSGVIQVVRKVKHPKYGKIMLKTKNSCFMMKTIPLVLVTL